MIQLLRARHATGYTAFEAEAKVGVVELIVHGSYGLRAKSLGIDLTDEEAIRLGSALIDQGKRAQRNLRQAEGKS